MIYYKISILSLLIGLTASTAFSQKSMEWALYEDSGKNISFLAPTKVVISKDGDQVKLHAFADGVALTVLEKKATNPQKTVKEIDFSGPSGSTGETYKTRDYLVRRLNLPRKNEIQIILYAASKTAYFQITLMGRKTNPTIDRFLKAIRFGDVQLMPDTMAAMTGTGSPIVFDKLPESPEVKAALEHQNAVDIKPEFKPVKIEFPWDLDRFSQSLIVWKKVKPPYTDQARSHGVQGTILANVEFLKTGDIGNITVDDWDHYGLARNVALAIRGIKFIPAEVNGKPVDVTMTLEYQFGIY